jgi:hypothetical protein
MTTETRLDDLVGASTPLRQTLKAAGIITAEQLLGSVAALGGSKKMAALLGVALPEFQRLFDAAKEAVPLSERARLSAPADTRDLGLGALPPVDKQ